MSNNNQSEFSMINLFFFYFIIILNNKYDK